MLIAGGFSQLLMTPSLLAAVWAFSNSSLKFPLWILKHEHYGLPLWPSHNQGVIAPHVKALALVMMASGVVIFHVAVHPH